MSVVWPSPSSALAVVFIQVVCLGCSGGSRRQYVHADEGLTRVCMYVGVWALCICCVLGQQVLFETQHPPLVTQFILTVNANDLLREHLARL